MDASARHGYDLAARDTPGVTALDDPQLRDAFTRWEGAAGDGLAESQLRISGMHCATCADTVEAALRRVPGVVQARVSVATQCGSVRWDAARTRVSLLVQALQDAGYEAVPDTASAARGLRLREQRTALWRWFVASFCAMQVMMLAAPAYLSTPDDLPPDLRQLMNWGSWVLTLPVLWFCAAPFFAGAWRAVRHRRMGMDVPVALGIAVAFGASSAATFDPGGWLGEAVYFDSLTMFISFILAGRYLEMRGRHRAEAALEEATDRLPDVVLRIRTDGTTETVSARCLHRGDEVRVAMGAAFAADGWLTHGITQVDEALLTGESHPVNKRSGDPVMAGSVNLGHPVSMRVQHVGADTRYEAVLALMRSARSTRPVWLAGADRWATAFLWTVLATAALAGAAWSVLDPSHAVAVVVAVLIVTCPCALSLAAPATLLAAAAALARRGVLVRHLDAIERLARVQTVFVDKTGTLTEAQLRCVAVHSASGPAAPVDPRWAGLASSLAAWSAHPLAAALRQAFAPIALDWTQVREVPGCGMEAFDPLGHCWRLGSADWAGVGWVGNATGVHTHLACDGRCVARFDFDERLRPGALAAVRALQAQGMRVALLSGDATERVKRVAAALGLDAAAGALTPADKHAAVRAAQQRGEVVAMLGDGINDAPVLAQADVSFAMGEGATLARAQADAVLVSNHLGDVVAARAAATRAVRIVRQNLVWASLYNAACVPLALAGRLPPWAAGLGMAVSSLVVVANALRAGRLSKA